MDKPTKDKPTKGRTNSTDMAEFTGESNNFKHTIDLGPNSRIEFARFLKKLIIHVMATFVYGRDIKAAIVKLQKPNIPELPEAVSSPPIVQNIHYYQPNELP